MHSANALNVLKNRARELKEHLASEWKEVSDSEAAALVVAGMLAEGAMVKGLLDDDLTAAGVELMKHLAADGQTQD